MTPGNFRFRGRWVGQAAVGRESFWISRPPRPPRPYPPPPPLFAPPRPQIQHSVPRGRGRVKGLTQERSNSVLHYMPAPPRALFRFTCSMQFTAHVRLTRPSRSRSSAIGKASESIVTPSAIFAPPTTTATIVSGDFIQSSFVQMGQWKTLLLLGSCWVPIKVFLPFFR